MKNYKSAYPILKRKLRDPFSAIHLKWVRKATDFHHGDAKSKLHASIAAAHMGESVESKANSDWIEKQNVKEPVRKQDKKMAEQKDRIGKKTPSAAEIAKKHGKPLADIHMQIAKGRKVEREHTGSDEEAAEIARDHLDEFPDYYDRLKTMEKQAKKEMKEDAANSVGGGNIAGMPTADTPDTSVPRGIGMIRRKKFAGKTVFVVDPTTFHNAYLGKRKYEHYEKYLEGCDIAEEIRQYGRKYWDEPIILQNEQTGAMVYLKYGSK